MGTVTLSVISRVKTTVKNSSKYFNIYKKHTKIKQSLYSDIPALCASLSVLCYKPNTIRQVEAAIHTAK